MMNYNMKQITTFLESKGKKIETNVSLDDFQNDLYNVLSDLMFEYNQAGKNVNKSEFEKSISVNLAVEINI